METPYETVRTDRLFPDECIFCHLPSQLFQYCDSQQRNYLNYIHTYCNYEEDGTPCMNLQNYEFVNDGVSNYLLNEESK